eukprot:TRINITY_DN59598_c0_g1_i1.p1 TRINITY_DN59598_c0_g1~~TRINITY_DN59598_c0_g1_i1.p1  ORF type:complete len:297 (+),score=74.85 TRINITY_DN59598_c0_g1_i1:108-998(+)
MNGSAAASTDGGFRRSIEEYQLRERVYRAGLLEREAEVSRSRRMASDVGTAYGDVSRAALRASLADPAVNMEVLLLRQRALEKDRKIRQLREELEANRFDQQLPEGQALMRKCRALLEENHELGEQLREDRAGDLEAALTFERSRTAELVAKLKESTEFGKELQQENEKLQGTMSRVAGRLREARAEIRVITKERAEAKQARKRLREQMKLETEAPLAPETSDNLASAAVAPVLVPTHAPAPLPAVPEPVSNTVASPPEAAPAIKAEKEKKSKKRKKEDKSEKQKVSLKSAVDAGR